MGEVRIPNSEYNVDREASIRKYVPEGSRLVSWIYNNDFVLMIFEPATPAPDEPETPVEDPPADDPPADDPPETDDDAFDPVAILEGNAVDIRAAIGEGTYTRDQVETLLAAERDDKNRKTIVETLEAFLALPTEEA